MKVILTGATGAIGLSLIEDLLSRSYEVLVLASPRSPRNNWLSCMTSSNLRWQECALMDYESFNLSERFDAMVHMAWEGGMDRWNIDLNIASARQCAMAVRLAARVGCKTFLGIGSQAECGPQVAPLTSETLCKPQTPFGAAKNLALNLVRIEAAQIPEMRFMWARILSVYGPRDRESAMITASLRKLIQGELPKFSSGEQIWDFLYVDDAARGLANMLERGHNGQIYVLGSGDSRPLRDYLEYVVRPFGVDLAKCLGKVNVALTSPSKLEADITTMYEHLGWFPTVDFQTGISRTIEYCKKSKP